MANLDPNQVAATWAQRLASSGDRIAQGVNAVTVAPGQAAARQKAAYTAGVQASADKWATRVAAVPLGEWQQAMIQKGAPRIAQGAAQAEPKMAAFLGQFLPYVQQQVQALPPRGNLDQNIARMTALVRGVSKFQRR